MIKEAMEFFANRTDRGGIETVREQGEWTTYLLRPGAGEPARLERMPRPPALRAHVMETLEGLVEYLDPRKSDPSSSRSDVVFVERGGVVAILNYLSHERETVRVPLVASEEFEALETLRAGATQKQVWRELVTRLSGCVEEELLSAISAIRITAKNQEGARIDRVGVRSASSETSAELVVQYQGAKAEDGQQQARLREAWTFTGRIWEAFDQAAEIKLTLEIDLEKDLRFIFHARRLEAALRAHRARLIEDLRVRLAPLAVYEGEPTFV